MARKRNYRGAKSLKNRTVKHIPKKVCDKIKRGHVGYVYRGRTKYIDKETKLERNYVVVKERNENVTVAKLKSIKKFDNNGKNADNALVEINHERYGLPERTGIDYQKFSQNQMSKKPLRISDKDVFPEGKSQFQLSKKDTDRAIYHTGVKKRIKKKK